MQRSECFMLLSYTCISILVSFSDQTLLEQKYMKTSVTVEIKDSFSFIYPLKQWGQNVSSYKENRMIKLGSEKLVLKADASNDIQFVSF